MQHKSNLQKICMKAHKHVSLVTPVHISIFLIATNFFTHLREILNEGSVTMRLLFLNLGNWMLSDNLH
jgi:hypothetical protein